MKVNYYPDTDTLYIDLSNRPGADAVEVTADLVVDVDEEGAPVGIEIEHAGEKMDLSRLEVEGLPGFASVTVQGSNRVRPAELHQDRLVRSPLRPRERCLRPHPGDVDLL